MKKITLKNLAEATEQEVFDQVASHLFTQGRKCVNDYGGCMYRLGELRCAAGCLIDDDEYDPNMESNHWFRLNEKTSHDAPHARFIAQLQNIHDCDPILDWPELLKKAALSRGLEWKFDDIVADPWIK